MLHGTISLSMKTQIPSFVKGEPLFQPNRNILTYDNQDLYINHFTNIQFRIYDTWQIKTIKQCSRKIAKNIYYYSSKN